MRDKLFETLSTIINDILRREGVTDFTPNFTVVIPDDAAHGDYATNGAMQLARPLRKNPKAIAEEIALRAEAAFGGGIKAQVAGPGFINFTISK